MCGIALIISGIKIDLSFLFRNYSCLSPQSLDQVQPLFTEDDLRVALQRRGPDSVGAKSVYIDSKILSDGSRRDDAESVIQIERGALNGCGNEELRFVGSTLQLRGVNPVAQPCTDASGNVLVYNGEIFGGIHVISNSNDTEILVESLGCCCSCMSHDERRSNCSSGGSHDSVPELLSRIKGPWALIYWQGSSKTLWFGRDSFGRRSLLVHWPTPEDPRLLLSSVSPPSSVDHICDTHNEKGSVEVNFWEELQCGIYSISMSPRGIDGYIMGVIRKHEWTDSKLVQLITWERTSIQPKPENMVSFGGIFPKWQIEKLPTVLPELGSEQSTASATAHKVLMVLRESVMRRAISDRTNKAFLVNHTRERDVPVAVLFSGGLDSMIIAALLHQCIDSEYEIDLLNVSFDGELAPDRISARAGLKELQNCASSRRWNLVEIDADLLKLASETKHVMSLINPAKTYMDLNIGMALWLSSGGEGCLYDAGGAECGDVKYKSEARILLVGSGADEQCAGYGRHRTKYRNKSWLGLHEEMKLDMQRIWKRNLGRDDRCIADNGKEARFPFLDEDVIRVLLDIPLWVIADLDQPSGVGDKKILREVARLLNLNEAAALPKRAIQFGSRIARESNRKNFGSNRAANQASAGTVEIYGPPK